MFYKTKEKHFFLQILLLIFAFSCLLCFSSLHCAFYLPTTLVVNFFLTYSLIMDPRNYSYTELTPSSNVSSRHFQERHQSQSPPPFQSVQSLYNTTLTPSSSVTQKPPFFKPPLATTVDYKITVRGRVKSRAKQ